jgi:hypothetical protein
VTRSFVRTRSGLLVAIVAGLALLTRPLPARAETRVEVRVELRAGAAPDLVTAFAPGGTGDLTAIVGSVDGDIDPTACTAHVETAPDGSSAEVAVGDCADATLSASAQVSLDSSAPAAGANVDYRGATGNGAAFCVFLIWVVIVILIIVFG